MLLFFQVCFFVGFGLILLSFVCGTLLGGFGIDGLDFDFDLFGFDLMLPLSPITVLLFFTIFGGSGWIFYEFSKISAVFIFLLALIAGVAVVILFTRFIMVPLKKAQNTSAPDKDELIGVPAKVTETIYENGFGEITYIVNGNSFVAPAKSTTGEEIKKGSDIAICWIEDHIFYVTNVDK